MSFWVAGAAVVGTVGGAVISSNAAGRAANKQADASQAALSEQGRQFDLQREDSAPYRETGARALKQLEDANTLDGSALIREVQSDPGYQWGQQQGQLGLDRKIAAGGGRISGAALRASSQFNSDYASTGFGAAYQRRQDRLNRLAALAGIGQTSTASSAAAGATSANAISKLISSQGDAAGAASLAQGNIWAGAGNQLASLYGRKSTTAPTTGGWGGLYSTNSDPFGSIDYTSGGSSAWGTGSLD